MKTISDGALEAAGAGVTGSGAETGSDAAEACWAAAVNNPGITGVRGTSASGTGMGCEIVSDVTPETALAIVPAFSA